MMGRSHKDRVAVITGTTGGLGQAFALRMAEEGCHLALTDIRSCKEISTKVEALGRDVYHERCDLAVPDDIQKFADNVLSRFGTVDILVNNAAYMHRCSLEEIDLETFQMYEKVNLDAPMLFCKAISKILRDQLLV